MACGNFGNASAYLTPYACPEKQKEEDTLKRKSAPLSPQRSIDRKFARTLPTRDTLRKRCACAPLPARPKKLVLFSMFLIHRPNKRTMQLFLLASSLAV